MRLVIGLIILAVSVGAHSSTTGNLLTNPGFESGLTGWSAPPVVATRSTNPSAYEGVNYIYAPNTFNFNLHQTIDLLANGISTSAIDAGIVDVEFGGWQAGFSGFDVGIISVSFLNASSDVLSVESLGAFTSSSVWQLQSATANLLAGTRFIKYNFYGERVSGGNADAYLDAAFLEVTAIPVPAAIWLFGSGLLGLARLARRRI